MKCCGTFFFVLFLQLHTHADFRASIYKSESNDRELLFSQEFIEKEITNGQFKIESRFKNADGVEVIKESATLNSKGQVEQLQIEQLQTAQKASIFVDSEKIEFKLTEGNGKTKTSSEKRSDLPLVSTLNFGRFIQESWSQIISGKKVEFRLLVWDRMETVGFQMVGHGLKQIRGKNCYAVEMQASTFLIRQLVDPIQMCYQEDGKRIFDLFGRVAPKLKVGDKFKDLDAHVVYFY